MSLDTSILESGHYNTEIFITTNSGEFHVPVCFRKPLRWDIITRLTARVGIPIGLCLSGIRLFLGNHLSVGLDDSWMLSYPPEVQEAPFLRFISPLELLGIPKVQLICSIVGGVIIFAISIVIWYMYHDYFEYLREGFRLKVESFFDSINESIESLLDRIKRNIQWRYNYYSYSQKSRGLIYKVLQVSLLLLIIWNLFGFIINCLVNALAWIGASFIVFTDLTAYSLTGIGITQPEIGWLVLGCFIGVALGLIQAVKLTKQYSSLSKVDKKIKTIALILAIVLILTLNTFLNWGVKPTTDPFPRLVLKEEFKPPSKSWGLPPGTAMKDGGLFRQEPRTKTSRYSLWYGHIFKDVDFSADTKKISGANNIEFGIFARYSSGNFYYLLINGDGQFAMGKHSKSRKRENKIGWQKSTAIKQGNNRNRLRIVCNEKKVIGWVNDQRVGVFEDDSYTSGHIGVISGRGDGEAVSVYFDNVLAKEKPE